MDRAVRLIVNPSAGAGRAARELPAVGAALRAHGVSFRVDRTTSIEHARELAREACRSREIAAAMGGDGLAGAVAGELRGTDGVMAVLPGGRGNDLATSRTSRTPPGCGGSGRSSTSTARCSRCAAGARRGGR